MRQPWSDDGRLLGKASRPYQAQFSMFSGPSDSTARNLFYTHVRILTTAICGSRNLLNVHQQRTKGTQWNSMQPYKRMRSISIYLFEKIFWEKTICRICMAYAIILQKKKNLLDKYMIYRFACVCIYK